MCCQCIALNTMCSFRINSIILLIASCSSLTASIVMYCCNVKINLSYYIGMFMVSSLFVCSSITWLMIDCFVRERVPRRIVVPSPRIEYGTIQIIPYSSHKQPYHLKEYTVTIPTNCNVVLGTNDQDMVIVSQP